MDGSGVLQKTRGFLREEYELAFRHEHWHVGIVDAPIRAFLEPDAKLDVRWFPLPSRGTYLADPFGLPSGRGDVILSEEFSFRANKGIIVWAREQEGGLMSEPRGAIELPFHASYPYLVERSGEVFCIPETAQGREVALYRAVDFPRRWTKEAVLLHGVAALDPTIFEHGGRVWLTHTDLDDGPFSKLRIWHAADLFGPWEPHVANPVKTDIGSARPAGTPFRFAGELYRPAQDSTTTYGGRVALNRIVRLSPTEFREERVATLAPFRDGPHSHGIHTLSAFGDRTLVDGKRYAFNSWAMGRNLRAGIGGRWIPVLRHR